MESNNETVAEIAGLRECLNIAEDALEKIDNMCDGDMCKCFDNTHHCSACRYLDECQTGVAHAALYEIREMIGREATDRQPVTDCNRLGNTAKMREALSDSCYAMFNFLKTQNGGYEEMAKALDKAKAALATPPRNCDRFSNANEALEAFANEKGETLIESIRWLFAETKEEAK